MLSDRKMYRSILEYFSFSTGCVGEDKANKSLAKSTNSECRRYIQCIYIYIIVLVVAKMALDLSREAIKWQDAAIMT